MGPTSLAAVAKSLATGAVVLACLCDAPPEDIDGLLHQAAQHFADLEDDQAKVILDELAEFNVPEAEVLLGYLYSDPLYPGRDYEKAVVAFEDAAADGSDEALFQIAESRYWPDYNDWTLTAQEQVIRPTAKEAFYLLRHAVGNRPRTLADSGAPYWRLAWLCTYGDYDCGEEVTAEAVRQGGLQIGNLRMIASAYGIFGIQRSGEADTPENAKALNAYVALGMAAADPFVAALVTDSTWRDAGITDHCPNPISLEAEGRLLALEANAVPFSDGWVDFKHCFSARQLAAVKEDLVLSLDKLARAYGYQSTWHLRTCYQDPDAPSFGDCLIHAVRDHYFACTKLSLIDYFRVRYKIYYANSERYARCREAMMAARMR